MMTFKDDARTLGRTLLRWIFGLSVAGFGAYIVVAKIALWPGLLVFGFGAFILRPDDLTAFAKWGKQYAGDYLSKPGAPQ